MGTTNRTHHHLTDAMLCPHAGPAGPQTADRIACAPAGTGELRRLISGARKRGALDVEALSHALPRRPAVPDTKGQDNGALDSDGQ